MAVQLNLAYSKKIGLPEYSSHSLAVSVTAEIANLDQIEVEVQKLYGRVQRAVDEQIVNAGFVPGQQPAAVAATAAEPPAPKVWKCSTKQRDLVLKIVSDNSIDKGVVEALAVQRFKRGVTGLNKLEMSGLIDELLERYGRKLGRAA
jgi:hypothetical protein